MRQACKMHVDTRLYLKHKTMFMHAASTPPQVQQQELRTVSCQTLSTRSTYRYRSVLQLALLLIPKSVRGKMRLALGLRGSIPRKEEESRQKNGSFGAR